jgi:tetratricopeptide (TPR) repeat protein
MLKYRLEICLILIKDALEGALGSVRLGTVASLVRITSNWERIVGPQLSGVCSPAYIWQKTLIVHVDDPAFLAPLDYSRMTILEKTKAVLGDETTVQSISVRYNEEKAVKKFGQKDGVSAPAGAVSEKIVEPLSAVKDPSLKGALEGLFKASLGAGKKLAAVAVAAAVAGMAASCATAGKMPGSRNAAQHGEPSTSDEKKAAKAETDADVAKRSAKEKDAYFYFLRAQMHIHENQFPEAMTDLRAILELNPRFIEAYVEMTKLSLALGKVDDAVETAQKGLAISPDNAVLNSLLGVIYHNSKDYKRAEDFLKKSLAADPSREDVRLNLAFNYLAEQKFDDAERELLEILKKNPASNMAMIYLAKAYVDSKAYYKAEEFLTRYTMDFPEVPQGYSALGWVYSVQGKYDLAVDVYKKYLEKSPHDPEMQQHLANAYLLKKSYGEALDVYKEIEKEAPGAADLEYKMGVIYFQQGQLRDALEKFQLVRLSQPGNKTVPYYIARVDEELGM